VNYTLTMQRPGLRYIDWSGLKGAFLIIALTLSLWNWMEFRRATDPGDSPWRVTIKILQSAVSGHVGLGYVEREVLILGICIAGMLAIPVIEDYPKR
jgi:hypothetical protein